MRGSTCLLLITLTAFVTTSSAQKADPSSVAFEAASVKVNKSGESNVSVGPRPGRRFNATNVPLPLLITMAYQLQPFQLQGAPAWTGTDRFDIVAKFDGDPVRRLPVVLFANGLANQVQRIVVDRTGLTGNWDFEFTFTPVSP